MNYYITIENGPTRTKCRSKFKPHNSSLQYASLKCINRFWTWKSISPPYDKRGSIKRFSKSFVLFWNRSRMYMNIIIDQRTNEHHITDHIKLTFLLNMARLIRIRTFRGPDFSDLFLWNYPFCIRNNMISSVIWLKICSIWKILQNLLTPNCKKNHVITF